MKPLKMLVGALALLSLSAQAKTVALWPLESVDTEGGVRCVIDPQNDLSINTGHKSNTGTNAMWALPPNPDTDRHAVEPINHSAVRETYSGSGNGFLSNNYTARLLRRDRAFTIEGWMKVINLPASNTWACILSVYTEMAPGSVDNNRWTFSLRRRPEENYACSWIFWGNGAGTDAVIYRYADEEASYAITNTWIHIAITHSPLVSGKDNWAFYLNGGKIGEFTKTGSVTDAYTKHRFDLGARSSGNHIDAVFDYWRISDKVLAPSEFLCAGDSSGTPAPTSHTVAYWPLGVTPNGGIDCRDAVGNSPLTGGFTTGFVPNCMTPVEDCAFTGNPPNPTVTLPNGNAGSVLGCATAACLQNDALGAVLNVTSNFTVEGWFCPRVCERTIKEPSQEVCCYLLGTRPDGGKGWALQYRGKGINQIQFDLYGVDGTNATFCNNRVFSGSFNMNTWYDRWRHLALTYDAEGGANAYGQWSLYIDGELYGRVDNGRKPAVITSARPFILGGRGDRQDHSFQGKIDCARVCAKILTPDQFLNAVNGTAATDVIGLWPLNVEHGAFPDLRDVSGKNNHFADRNSNYSIRLVSADSANAPTITNPDRSVTFRGDPSAVNGSVRYRNPDASTDNHQATLVTYSTAVRNTIAAGKDFTFEFYYLRRKASANVSGDQEVFLCANSGSYAKIRFFRKTDGFYIWENWNGSLSDTRIDDTADSDLEYDRWYHVALVHSIELLNDVSSSVWRIYLDGALKGQPSCERGTVTGAPADFFVGGRWVNKNSVIGNLSSIRLSNRALVPSEFLCATPAASTKPEPTVGYWPIDSVQPGLANLADAEYPLEADGTAAGQAEPARLSIPNKNALTNVVTGAARQNHGSYALGVGGTLAAASIGFDMAGPRSFTVEGWLKWTPAEGTADEDLITVGDALTSNGGLRIFFDKTGETPKLRVFARGAWPCTPYVDGAFDADLTSLVGTWAHVAIAYDANDGEGSWTLYVEGKQVGQVKNFYRPTTVDYSRGGDFTLGSTVRPLSAAVDMWRVSTVAYAPEDLLYAPPAGMTILFR